MVLREFSNAYRLSSCFERRPSLLSSRSLSYYSTLLAIPRHFSGTRMMATSRGPKLPPGRDKHHIVVLEAIHAPMPTFDFPHTITKHPRSQANEVQDRIKDADIVIACIAPITPAMLETSPYLGCVCVMAVGISWMDREAFAKAGVTVTNCPAGNVEAVGEHVLALYFGLRKRIVEMDTVIKNEMEWAEKGTLAKRFDGPPRGLSQEIIGILGYGNLGKRIQRNFELLGAKEVLVADRKGSDEKRAGRTPFEEVMKRASVIVVCVPKADDTIDLIADRELRMMQKDTLVINVARGGIVNEEALAQALEEKWIGGGAVDVMEVEPNGPGMSPLIPDKMKGRTDLPNLIISPHLAWFAQSTIANYQRMLKEGAERWVEGTMEQDGNINPVAVVHNGKVWRS